MTTTTAPATPVATLRKALRGPRGFYLTSHQGAPWIGTEYWCADTMHHPQGRRLLEAFALGDDEAHAWYSPKGSAATAVDDRGEAPNLTSVLPDPRRAEVPLERMSVEVASGSARPVAAIIMTDGDHLVPLSTPSGAFACALRPEYLAVAEGPGVRLFADQERPEMRPVAARDDLGNLVALVMPCRVL